MRWRKRRGDETFFCSRCGGPHPTAGCDTKPKKSNAPLETPSHNGIYQGTIPVRTLPPGAMSAMPDEGKYMKRYREQQWRAERRRTVRTCRWCKAEFETDKSYKKFCQMSCYKAYEYAKYKRKCAKAKLSAKHVSGTKAGRDASKPSRGQRRRTVPPLPVS